MNTSELKTSIIKAIKAASQNTSQYKILIDDKSLKPTKNDFLFFIKPELTMQDGKIKLDAVLDLILERINSFGLTIASVGVLSSQYLNEFDIIAQHYGVINRISRHAKQTLTDEAKKKFEEIYKKDFHTSEVLGSLEFITAFPEFTPLTLDYLWQNKKFEKLAGGTYSLDLNFNGREVFLINGFHPRQLDHFTRNGRSIVTFTLSGDLNWAKARNEFIGATNPAVANEGSLRRTFFEKQNELGLPAISSSWNGVHLSAGPIEGLVELMRYNSNFSEGISHLPKDYRMGKLLFENFDPNTLNGFLNNASLNFEGKRTNTFDLTEEKDSDEAITLLKKASFL